MAQRVEIILIDDLDGSEAGETILFGLDGSTYEIDLNEENASRLREIISPFQKAGRVQEKKPQKGRGGGRTSSREHSIKVRLWAQNVGYPVNERGRIPKWIMEKYTAAHD